MKYLELVRKLKAEQKQLVSNYVSLKRTRSAPTSVYLDVRIKHIAYSMLRGKTFEQIEQKWREPDSSVNAWTKHKALLLLDEYKKMVENEVVCHNS